MLESDSVMQKTDSASFERVLVDGSPWRGTWWLGLAATGHLSLSFFREKDGLSGTIEEATGVRRSPDGPLRELRIDPPRCSFVTASGIAVELKLQEIGHLIGMAEGDHHLLLTPAMPSHENRIVP